MSNGLYRLHYDSGSFSVSSEALPLHKLAVLYRIRKLNYKDDLYGQFCINDIHDMRQNKVTLDDAEKALTYYAMQNGTSALADLVFELTANYASTIVFYENNRRRCG